MRVNTCKAYGTSEGVGKQAVCGEGVSLTDISNLSNLEQGLLKCSVRIPQEPYSVCSPCFGFSYFWRCEFFLNL